MASISTVAAIYDKEMSSIEEYVRHFRLIDSQVGAIFMINGQFPLAYKPVMSKTAVSSIPEPGFFFQPEGEREFGNSQRAHSPLFEADRRRWIKVDKGLGSELRMNRSFSNLGDTPSRRSSGTVAFCLTHKAISTILFP